MAHVQYYNSKCPAQTGEWKRKSREIGSILSSEWSRKLERQSISFLLFLLRGLCKNICQSWSYRVRYDSKKFLNPFTFGCYCKICVSQMAFFFHLVKSQALNSGWKDREPESGPLKPYLSYSGSTSADLNCQNHHKNIHRIHQITFFVQDDGFYILSPII